MDTLRLLLFNLVSVARCGSERLWVRRSLLPEHLRIPGGAAEVPNTIDMTDEREDSSSTDPCDGCGPWGTTSLHAGTVLCVANEILMSGF